MFVFTFRLLSPVQSSKIFQGCTKRNATNTSRQSKKSTDKKGQDVEVNAERPQTSTIVKHVVYTAVAVPTIFTGCAIWQYERIRNESFLLRHQRWQQKEMGIRDHINSIWNSLSPVQKFTYTFVGVNAVVFLMWRVPALQPFMLRYFTHLPAKSHSVLGGTLCGLSHSSGLHFLVNMYVFASFVHPMMPLFGKEQTLAVFLGGATFSSLVSAIFRLSTKSMIPSLGASGGILTLVAITCLTFPDSKLAIAFVDQIIPHSFSAESAVIGIVLFDLLGILLRWKLLDHAGHLGGVAFGVWYAKYGHEFYRDYRNKLLQFWHGVRTGKN
ncbi:hypothetical protein DPMN_140863 [Dreissena polymorpha]|uniref:rhomboid protease n=1 Tax=Dreissena polymorpha TaxID=45954 RepID=A0A9D4GEA9_DREPO|nr:hypothetical protein DPMN_140863 [Dreissena polymorpha]